MATRRNDDDIDYTSEGATPPREKEDPTNAYDEAAHSGPGRCGVLEGEGGVFGTTGDGTSERGFHEWSAR